MTLVDIIIKVLSGATATFTIFFLTLLFSLPLGLLIMFCRNSKNKILRFFSSGVISILRGTPLMLQLIVWCFAPYYLFKVRLTPSWRILSIIIGFSINYAAYFAEIYRSGLSSIDVGQYEAASVLGFSKSQTFIKIILPQMVRNVLPSVTNEIITLIKDTSFAFVVAYQELFTIAKQLSATKTSLIPLFVAGVFYYVFNYIVAFTMEFIERKINYYK